MLQVIREDMKAIALLMLELVAIAVSAAAQERPYFVTYSHEMEEPGNLDIELFSAVGKPPGANRFLGSDIEFEYGVKTWWTTEFYMDGQATVNDSTIFTGYRWENRFRPMLREHWINPVIYVEFENISADKTLREVVGHDGVPDFAAPNWLARQDKAREIETKLILGSNYRGWNISENLIAEKNLSNGPWEFGYAWAVSRPFKLAASTHKCVFCAERFQAGLEMYGGLGDRYSLGLNRTSHYVGPTVDWSTPGNLTLSFSPQVGLNDYSIPRIYRFGIRYEIEQVLGILRGGN